MGVTIAMPLFGNPGHELEEGSVAKSKDLRALGVELRDRLAQAAETVDKLQAGGWTMRVAMFDLMLSHPKVQTRDQAERRLRTIEVDPTPFLIIEDIEEDLE